MFDRLSGKHAVVIGAGSGMGASLARALDRAGARVVIGGRRVEALQETAAGTRIICQAVDVADRDRVSEFFQSAFECLETVDVLVIAAGANIKNRSMAQMQPEQWDQLMAVNATGAYNCMHAVLPAMRARRCGTIMNISSIAGKRAIALGGIAYSASKFAMTALGTCVSNEVASDGVRVINVYPGEVNTPLLEQRPSPVTEQHKHSILQPDDVAELLMSVLNLPDNVHVAELVVKPLNQNWY
ncbi:MAG: SDR family oxidoreductase [Pirellulaceae bacterium]|nr:SDR family oxidoreductase [Pirellulaceae bacterium]